MNRKMWMTTLALLASGCAVGPDYQPARPQTPASFNDAANQNAPGVASRAQTTATDPRWWKSFHSPQLDSLIERAIAGNLSLQQTVLRIAGSREQITQAGGAFYPSVNGSASVTRQQLGLEGELKSHGVYDQLNEADPSLNGALDPLTKPITLYQGSFDASWELDLWGKVRRQVEAAKAQQDAAIEQRNDALVSLEAEVARAWLQLRGAQSVMQTLQTQIDTAQQTLELTTSRQKGGLSPQMDVENARAQLGNLQAQLPQYQAQERQAMNGLAVLLGKPPGALDPELTAKQALPKLPDIVSVGIPANLARRRPDVREAEANLHAATAQIGVSVAQLFPSLSLTGQLGLRNDESGYLLDWASHFYSFGPQVSIPIFQGGPAGFQREGRARAAGQRGAAVSSDRPDRLAGCGKRAGELSHRPAAGGGPGTDYAVAADRVRSGKRQLSQGHRHLYRRAGRPAAAGPGRAAARPGAGTKQH